MSNRLRTWGMTIILCLMTFSFCITPPVNKDLLYYSTLFVFVVSSLFCLITVICREVVIQMFSDIRTEKWLNGFSDTSQNDLAVGDENDDV